MSSDKKQLDLTAIRERLRSKTGRDYWRSLEELADTEEFRELMHREFPRQASEWDDQVGRRGFLKLMSASLALAGLGACTTQPLEKILPYVRPPEQLVPGKPLFFATAMTLGGNAIGLLAESHMGRPTKIEGNPTHPASLGATDAYSQASVLSLYDPDRAQAVTERGRIRSWSAFQVAVAAEVDTLKTRRGQGLRILTETVGSPTLRFQLQELIRALPQAKWYEYEPVNWDNRREGTRLAFGQTMSFHYRLDQAKIVLSLGADFLCSRPESVRYARDFTARRRAQDNPSEMNRLYVVESVPSPTGSIADHRLPLRPSELERFAQALAAKIAGGQPDESAPAGEHSKWLDALARDLTTNRGQSLVIPGEFESPEVQRAAHQINSALGNIGKTIEYTAEPDAQASQSDGLRQLAGEMGNGQVDVLIILGANPVYSAPADLKFAERIMKPRLRVHLSAYLDETSRLCHWHVPETHYLEQWSDAVAFDGTATIVQPLITPLYESRSAHEIVSLLQGRYRSGYDSVRDLWRSRRTGTDFERFWRTALNDGVVPGTGSAPPMPAVISAITPGTQTAPQAGQASQTSSPTQSQQGQQASAPQSRRARVPLVAPQTQRSRKSDLEVGPTGRGPTGRPGGASLELIFRPDASVYDGRFSNNGWLQELPRPLTKLTWDNAALISPRTAEKLGVGSEDVVELKYRSATVQAPVWVMPGHADECVTVHFGHGREYGGKLAAGVGFNAFRLRQSDAPWGGPGLEVRKTGERHRLAVTQTHWSIEGRNIVRTGTVEEYRQNPHFVHEKEHGFGPELSLYPEYNYEGNAWGMAIDLNACLGCNACVVACQAENNIPVVGKDQVIKQREMHWLRIDTYHEGNLDNPKTVHQPMLCQHCEKAPCEVVCPVAATVHSSEGLNDMVYNRCVGTRYCSNNCPYKVRRFNFLQYTDKETPSLKVMHNPDVTVRDRGVMEKCTYCVQRINAARIEAKKEDRPIRDGEVVTACQAACPTHAIVFGNINDPNSQVAKLKKLSLNYSVLGELNTQPRTTYLASLRNPNPELGTE